MVVDPKIFCVEPSYAIMIPYGGVSLGRGISKPNKSIEGADVSGIVGAVSSVMIARSMV